jgi:hypothetical protein
VVRSFRGNRVGLSSGNYVVLFPIISVQTFLLDRLTDFPFITKWVNKKEDTITVVFVRGFCQNVELLATH